MIKIIAAALILTSSSLLGALLSQGLSTRVTELEKTKVFMTGIRLRIQYTAHDIERLFDSYMEENIAALPVYLKLYKNNKSQIGLSPQENLCECVDMNESKKALPEGDRSCIKSFFISLGSGDVESESSLCELYEELLSKRLEEARIFAGKYSNLYTLLGVLTGIALIILLI